MTEFRSSFEGLFSDPSEFTPMRSRNSKPRPRVDLLAQWEGVVLSIGDDTFTARVLDLSGQYPEEEAEFAIDDVSPADLTLFQTGASFYWSLGYETRISGQRVRTSEIRFRRLPPWTAAEIESGRDWARNVADLLDLN